MYGDFNVGTGSIALDSGGGTRITVGGVSFYYGGAAPPPPYIPPPPAAVAAATGVNPIETSYSLYGHTIPLSVFGVGRIGGEIIAGPWVSGGLASFIISFGVPADPTGTRDIREIAFDSEVVWTTSGASGVTTSAGGTFTTEAFTFNFKGGTLTQTVTSLETLYFGTQANAYRPQIILEFINLPLAGTKFNKIPYVSAVIGDASGNDVNLGEAFERLAASPWVGFTQFETSGITDGLVDGGLIITQDTEFLQLIQQFGRFYPQWDILQTDKLRIVDRGATVTADIALDATRLTGAIATTRQGQDTIKKDLELSTIDPDADYTIVPSKAQRPRDPVTVTTSVGKDSAYLPAIMDASTRTALVTLAKYHEEVTRKTISGTAMAYGLEIEPGDLVTLYDLGDEFTDETFKIIETLHGANYTVEFTAQAILKCFFGDGDPHWAHVVLLMGYEGANGSSGSPGFDDESITMKGTAATSFTPTISTAQADFGASSINLTSGPIFYAANSDWSLSSANADQFTVECSAYLNATGIDQVFLAVSNTGGHQGWLFGLTAAGDLEFNYSTTGATFNVSVAGAASPSTGQWYQFAADKDATGKIRVYKNGVMIASATPANSAIHDPGEHLTIGSDGLFSGKVNGYLDEVRITQDVARYASDSGYTPATAAFPRF